MTLSRAKRLNSNLLLCCFIINSLNIQFSHSLPAPILNSNIPKGHSQVSFTLFKRVSLAEWTKFVNEHRSFENKDVLLLVSNRPGVIPLSHYAYKIQHAGSESSVSDRTQFTHTFDRNFHREPSVSGTIPKQQIQTLRPPVSSGPHSDSAILFPDSSSDQNYWKPTRSTTPSSTSTSTTAIITSPPTANREQENDEAIDEFLEWANSGSTTNAPKDVMKTSTSESDSNSSFSLLNSGKRVRCRPGYQAGPNGACRKTLSGVITR